MNKKQKKISLKQLRKKSLFGKYVGCLKDSHKEKSSVDLQHEWLKYVD